MLKKIKVFVFLSFFLFVGTVVMSSCNRGSGCPSETANSRPDRHGNFSTKRGKSNLFPKNMRKQH